MANTDMSIGEVAYNAFHDFSPPRPYGELNQTQRMRWDFVAEETVQHSHKLIKLAASNGRGWTS